MGATGAGALRVTSGIALSSLLLLLLLFALEEEEEEQISELLTINSVTMAIDCYLLAQRTRITVVISDESVWSIVGLGCDWCAMVERAERKTRGRSLMVVGFN